MEKIYLLKNNKIMLGPFSIQKLKERNLKASDLIWYEGLPDWTPAGNLISIGDGGTQINEQPKQKFSFKEVFKKLLRKTPGKSSTV